MDYLCDGCKHQTSDDQRYCAAFPDGKPLPILSGEFTHDKPYPGDHDIQFEARDAEE